MTEAPRARWRTLAQDAFLGIAALALVLALAWPRAGKALLARRAAAVEADVEAVRAAAEALRAEQGGWPEPADPGVVPPDLAGRLPAGLSFQGAGFVLDWERWEIVEPPPPEAAPKEGFAVPPDSPLLAPPDSTPPAGPEVGELGGLTVQARDTRLLRALLERFGPRRSFVRDDTWTLVLGPEEP